MRPAFDPSGQDWRTGAGFLVASAVALGGALTVAQAALPRLLAKDAPSAPTLPSAIATPPPTPRRPPRPVALIAFQRPVPDGAIGSAFGLRRLPWESQARLHAGVDIIAPEPEPVRAAADGVVIRVGDDPGYGRFVELKHAEGLTTLYGHLERTAPQIASGVAVKAGTPVGRLGSTGVSTGVHLHFEIHDAQDRPLNPELFLDRSFAAARELPLSQARRVPRGVRVAYVSRIPPAKQALMQADLDDRLLTTRRAQGRVHSRLRL